MRLLFFILIFWTGGFFAQIHFVMWNIQDLGKSKNDSVITYIAKQLRDADLVGVVEVVAGNGGAQAVARLADALNRTGAAWDYTISDPTSGKKGSERYAFLWKKSKIRKKGDAWLEKDHHEEIVREPYTAEFIHEQKPFLVSIFHAIPKSKQPETEIKYIRFIAEKYRDRIWIIAGDFNCPQSHSVFGPIKKMGYEPVLKNCKTTIRQNKKDTVCLASEYDNIFYQPLKVKVLNSGVTHFYKDFPELRFARKISDHLPVTMRFEIKD
jgi:deoxyribonuclease-1-like protein